MAESDYIQPEDLPAEVHHEAPLAGNLPFEFPAQGSPSTNWSAT